MWRICMKNTIKLKAILKIAAIRRIAGITALAALTVFALVCLASCSNESNGTIVVVNNKEYTIDVTIIPDGSKEDITARKPTSVAAGESKAIAVVHDDSEGAPWYSIYLEAKFARMVFVRNGETVTVKFE